MKLSAIQVKNAKPKEKDYKLFDGEGLYLLVKKNGNKHWRLKYRFLKKEKLLAIGAYPLINLKEAREAKIEAKKLITRDIDPVAHNKAKKVKAIRNAQDTFKVIALEWYENKKDDWAPRYSEEVLKRLEDDVFPYMGNDPIRGIGSPLILEVVRRIENRGAVDLAKRQLQKIGEIFRYAIAIGKADKDPTYKMSEALKTTKTEHFASIETEELPQFLRAIGKNDARLYKTTRNALKLILHTFVRTSELINAPWEEFNFEKKIWLIPGERMKNRKDHIVPLSRQTIEILEDQKKISGQSKFLFPSPVKPQQPISNNTILGAIKRIGYKGRMTGHGARSLATTAIQEELGYEHKIVDRQLAHVPKSKTRKAYDRAKWLKERTRMMQDWSDFLDQQKLK